MKIDWLSKEILEGDIYLSDGKFEIVAFGHPFEGAVGDSYSLPLFALDTWDVFLAEDNCEYARRRGDTFEHALAGQVIDRDENLMRVGVFFIRLDGTLPGDIKNGNYISCVCGRLDLYCSLLDRETVQELWLN